VFLERAKASRAAASAGASDTPFGAADSMETDGLCGVVPLVCTLAASHPDQSDDDFVTAVTPAIQVREPFFVAAVTPAIQVPVTGVLALLGCVRRVSPLCNCVCSLAASLRLASLLTALGACGVPPFGPMSARAGAVCAPNKRIVCGGGVSALAPRHFARRTLDRRSQCGGVARRWCKRRVRAWSTW
jgi:hypothetical protein